MIKIVLTILILIYSFNSYSQFQKVTFTILINDVDCSLIQKQKALYININGADSLIVQDLFFDCKNEFEIPKINGIYHFQIKAEDYSTINAEFQITNDSPEIIDLNVFELKKNERNLEEVTITGIKRSFIQVDADKTTITVKDNAILTTSSLFDAIIKIPGIISDPDGGFSAYGKPATIYFEGIPGNLYGSDLTNFLKSLPATTIEKIEIISNPGASYDANVSGAIINIVSLSRVTKWISGTLTLNYGLNANNKILPSLVMSGKNKKISWQFQSGYSYFERSTNQTTSKNFTTFIPLVQLNTNLREQATNEFYYVKPSINYKITSRSNLILNYNLTTNQRNNSGLNSSTSQGISTPINLSNNYTLKGNDLNNNVILKYRCTLDTLKRVFEITANYFDYSQNQLTKSTQNENEISNFSILNNSNKIKGFYVKSDLELPFEKKKLMLKLGIKYNKLFANSLGSYNLQNPTEEIFQNLNYTNSLDFNYNEDNLGGYFEVKKDIKKLAVNVGFRVENFSLARQTSVSQTKSNTYLNIFPSVHAIYRFDPDMNLVGSYSRKIAVPSYREFDPNNSGYYDNYNSNSGNLLLKPNFFDNFELKFSVFDYLQLSVNYSHSQTYNIDSYSTLPNSLQSIHTYQTYHNVNSLNYFFSIPIPFGVFKEGLAYFNNSIDIEQINYMYIYTERSKTSISDYSYLSKNKPVWNHGISSQFILPYKIRMNVDYWVGTKGTFQIYDITRIQTALEVVISRDFLKKKLKTSISFQDILNQNQFTSNISFENLNLNFYNKNDTRIIWFKIAYTFGKFANEENESGIEEKNTKDNIPKL